MRTLITKGSGRLNQTFAGQGRTAIFMDMRGRIGWMNIDVVIAEIVSMIVLFSVLTMGMLLMNPLSFISDYPPEIQKQYYKSQQREDTKERLTVIMAVKKVVAILLFVVLLAWMLHAAGCSTFLQGFGYACILIFILFAWDTFVLDWVLFPNIPRARLPGTEQMDREYHQKWFHVKVCLPMLPVFAAMGALSSFLMTKIW